MPGSGQLSMYCIVIKFAGNSLTSKAEFPITKKFEFTMTNSILTV